MGAKIPSIPPNGSHDFQGLLFAGRTALFDPPNKIFSVKRVKFSAIQSLDDTIEEGPQNATEMIDLFFSLPN